MAVDPWLSSQQRAPQRGQNSGALRSPRCTVAEYADYTAVVSLGVKVFCGLARVELMDVRQRVPNPSTIFSSWQSKVHFTYVEAYRSGELCGDSIPQL
jgi:hypothetical protein